jgi:hypothetical protein
VLNLDGDRRKTDVRTFVAISSVRLTRRTNTAGYPRYWGDGQAMTGQFGPLGRPAYTMRDRQTDRRALIISENSYSSGGGHSTHRSRYSCLIDSGRATGISADIQRRVTTPLQTGCVTAVVTDASAIKRAVLTIMFAARAGTSTGGKAAFRNVSKQEV